MKQKLEDMVESEEFEERRALPAEQPLYLTEMRLLLDDAYRGARNLVGTVAGAAGTAVLHAFGGSLSANMQSKLHELLGDRYVPEAATVASILVTKPLFYGALTAYLAQHAGYSPWWGVGGALAGLIVEGGARIWWAVEISQADVVGAPLFGTLSEIAYQGCRAAGWAARQVGKNLSGAAERVRDYRNGLRERAIAEQARKDK